MATTRDTHSGQRRLVGRAGAGWLWSQTQEVAGRAVGQVQDVATWTAGEVESGASWTQTELKAHPYLGGLLAGAAGIAIGYAAYLVLAEGESPMKALGDAISWEQGELKRATRTSSNE